MERYIFKNDANNMDKVFESEDEKAIAALKAAEALVGDPDKNMTALMLISFDMNTAGMSFVDIAQFLYDNYSKYQLVGLWLSITNPSAVTSKKMHYESEEEMEALKKEANEIAKKFEEGAE